MHLEPPVDIHFALVCIEWELEESMVSHKPEQPLVCPEIRQAKNCLHQNNAVSVGRNSFPMMNEKAILSV